MSRTVLGNVGVTVETARTRTGVAQAVPAGVVGAGHDHRGRAVGGGADVEQVQRVGDHRAAEHVVDADLLAVARVGVGQPVPGVLDLDLREVLLGGAVEVHPAAGVEREVHRVGHAEQAEPQPVGVVPALAGVGSEEALGRGVRSDDQRHLGQPGHDPGARGVERLSAGGAGGVRRGDAGAVPAERLGEGGAGDVAAVAVAHGLAADDQVDVLPGDAGVGERGPGGVHAVRRRSCGPTCPRGACRPRGRRRRRGRRRSLVRLLAELGHGLPAPGAALARLVGVQRLDDELDLVADARGRRRRSPPPPGPARRGPRAARPRPARTARRGRWPARRAAGGWYCASV